MRISSVVVGVFLCQLPTLAAAELAIGGWVGLESNTGTSADEVYLYTDTLVSYSHGDLTFGYGIYNEWTDRLSVGDDNAGYYLLSYQDFTLTYGMTYGAGNLFPEDYFAFNDTTSISDEVVRLDFQFGSHSFAISNDLNGSGPSEIELGYSGSIAGFDVAAGYEADSEQVALLVGRNFGKLGVQVAVLETMDTNVGTTDHAGITLFYEPMKGLDLAGHVAYGTNGTVGMHSFGFLATYDAGVALLKAEYVKDVVSDTVDIEIGVVLPFGKQQPNGDARFALKEYDSRFFR